MCGVPLTGGPVCGHCQKDPPPIEQTIAPFRYAPPLSSAIQRLKYHGKLACGRDLGFLLAREIETRAVPLPDILVPVPLHWKRRCRRGFNQSLEIARPLSDVLGVPVETGLARRRVHTRPQVGQAPHRRRGNVRDVFQASGRTCRSVAIVDDVVTSGSTVTELARCLATAGAREIYVWALTRA
jgi:ComF family protein